MLCSITPYRVSLFGGGSDYPEYLSNSPGKVLSFSIRSYSYLFAKSLDPVFSANYRIRYFKRQEAVSIDEIQHPIVRHCLERYRYGDRLDITHSGDLPAMTGMGTSSAFTVGLIKVLLGLKNERISKKRLAKEAIFVEQVLNKENVGSQDQVAAAYGGLNVIKFLSPSLFEVNPVQAHPSWLRNFIASLRLVFTGLTRDANSVAGQVKADIHSSHKYLTLMCGQVDSAVDIILNQRDPCLIGELLHQAWTYKQKMSTAISNQYVDVAYRKILSAGAIGGKLLGAGGGGFILAFVHPDKLHSFDAALPDFKVIPLEIEWQGSRLRRVT